MKDQSRALRRLLEILDISDTDEDVILRKLQELPTESILKANIQLQLVSEN